jgi:spore maturation protein CgeB
MIKNFEAMACGCVLFAYDQGEEENRALGLVDMHNVVLYRSVEELRHKLEILRGDRVLTERIAVNGQVRAIENFSFAAVGKQIVDAMRPPLRMPRARTWLEWLLRRVRV